MNRYEKIAEEIMKRGDEILTRKKRRIQAVRNTSIALSGLCAAVIVGVSVWNDDNLQNGLEIPDNDIITLTTSCSSSITAETSTFLSVTTNFTTEIPKTSYNYTKINPSTCTSVITTTAERTEPPLVPSETTPPIVTFSESETITAEVPVHPVVMPANPATIIKFRGMDYKCKEILSETEKISTKISDIIVKIDEISTNAEVFEVSGFSSELTVAIRYENSSNYYIYCNNSDVLSVTTSLIKEILKNPDNSTTCTAEVPAHPVVMPANPATVIKFRGTDYKCKEILSETEKISAKISDVIVKTDEILTNAEVFEVSGFSSDFAIAIRYENSKDYYIYCNTSYFPHNISEFLSCGIGSNAEFVSAEYFDYSNGYRLLNYYGFDKSLIFELLSDKEVKSVDISALNLEELNAKMNIVCRMDGFSPFSISISEKGYISTNFFEKAAIFFIGEEKTSEFISLITENYPKEEF